MHPPTHTHSRSLTSGDGGGALSDASANVPYRCRARLLSGSLCHIEWYALRHTLNHTHSHIYTCILPHIHTLALRGAPLEMGGHRPQKCRTIAGRASCGALAVISTLSSRQSEGVGGCVCVVCVCVCECVCVNVCVCLYGYPICWLCSLLLCRLWLWWLCLCLHLWLWLR